MNRNSYGLLESELAEIVRIIAARASVRKACIFGSRAKGNHRPGSDVDIALMGEAVRHSDVLEIGYELNEDGCLPYQFDILDYNTLDNDALREHIDRVGKTIYEKSD